ncbi:hypothetical protein NPIL_224301, partial [Nephila pilipes]
TDLRKSEDKCSKKGDRWEEEKKQNMQEGSLYCRSQKKLALF